MNLERIKRLMDQAIRTFELDLIGQCVLTEAASGHYQLTPLIAALAGAEVIALTRDSRFGSAEDIRQDTLATASSWGVESRIRVETDRTSSLLQEANIVTNCGFVRPIDRELIDQLSDHISISLMWETWEFRDADLDLANCRSKGIPVLGTDEHHEDLNIFTYIGQVAIKLLMEAELEVFKSNILLIGSGEFAACTEHALKQS